jgi:hypothetical protein
MSANPQANTALVLVVFDRFTVCYGSRRNQDQAAVIGQLAKATGIFDVRSGGSNPNSHTRYL